MSRISLILLLLFLSACGRIFTDPNQYQIFFARIDGSEVSPIVSHPYLGMSHARVSPDRSQLTFTRYTSRRFISGYADEDDGYFGTEIMLVNIDGSDLRTLVPAKDGFLACNSTWTPEGNKIVYISTDTTDKLPKLIEIDPLNGHSSIVPTPKGLSVADPDIVGDWIVFPAIEEKANTIWIMKRDGSAARRLTNPKPAKDEADVLRYGDYDPKLSPDATKVAFMRYFGNNEWHMMVLDIASGHEHDLSKAGSFDAIPEWSGDGKLLIFLHVDFDDFKNLGIYTISPNGTSRSMVPLPRKMIHGHPRFFPGEKAAQNSRMVFTAKKNKFVP